MKAKVIVVLRTNKETNISQFYSPAASINLDGNVSACVFVSLLAKSCKPHLDFNVTLKKLSLDIQLISL